MRVRTLTTLFILTVSLVLAAGMAKAIDPFSTYLVLSALNQAASDARDKPVDRNMVSVNPGFNAYWEGNFAGANPDPRTIIAAVCRGERLDWYPADMSRANVLGVELIPLNTDKLPVKIGMYHKSLTRTEKVKEKDESGHRVTRESVVSDYVDLKIGDNEIIDGNPDYLKFELPLETGCLPQKLYAVKVRVLFIEKEAAGLFRMGRKNVLRRDETVCRFVVLDPSYMQRAIASTEIQSALRATFGLMAGPPTIGTMQFEIPAEIAQGVPPGLPTAGQPTPQQPNQHPVQQQPAQLPAPPVLSAEAMQQIQQQVQQTLAAMNPVQPVQPAQYVQPVQPAPQYVPQPAPQPVIQQQPPARIATVNLVIWKGSDHKTWKSVTVDLNRLQEGSWMRFMRGNQIVCDIEVGRTAYGIVEGYIVRGSWPVAGDSLVQVEVKSL